MTATDKVYLIAFAPIILGALGIYAFRLYHHFRTMR